MPGHFEQAEATLRRKLAADPLDNSIVLFPSRCIHEVTLVECGPGDFGAGRFTVNSYVWTRRVDGC